MPRYRHPRVDDGDTPIAGFAVDLGDEQPVVQPDGTFEADAGAVRTLASAYGMEPSALRVDGDSGGETCDTVKQDGEVCGRDLPCPYHSED